MELSRFCGVGISGFSFLALDKTPENNDFLSAYAVSGQAFAMHSRLGASRQIHQVGTTAATCGSGCCAASGLGRMAPAVSVTVGLFSPLSTHPGQLEMVVQFAPCPEMPVLLRGSQEQQMPLSLSNASCQTGGPICLEAPPVLIAVGDCRSQQWPTQLAFLSSPT